MAKTGSKLTDCSDAQLVEMALNGSQAAYTALYTRYHNGVRGHIASIVKNQDEIDDVCLESMEKAFKQLSSFNPEKKFSTWILTIARHTAYDYRDKVETRNKKMDTFPIESSSAGDVEDYSDSPEEAIINSQTHDTVLALVEGLPEIYREPVRLCLIDNLGYKEIAEKTGLLLDTVKTRIRRGRKMIEDELGKEEGL